MTDELVGEVAPAQRFDEAALSIYLERQIEAFGRKLVVQQIKEVRQSDVQVDDTRARRTAAHVLRKTARSAACERASGGTRVSRDEGWTGQVCQFLACATFVRTPLSSVRRFM
jgi:hypothetical protein